MDAAGKIISFCSSLLALAAVLVLAWTARSWVTGQIVKALRDELKYVRDELAQKDKDVHDLRGKERGHSEKLMLLERRYLRLEELEKERRIQLFGLERYAKRLETLCLGRNIALPSRDDEE